MLSKSNWQPADMFLGSIVIEQAYWRKDETWEIHVEVIITIIEMGSILYVDTVLGKLKQREIDSHACTVKTV